MHSPRLRVSLVACLLAASMAGSAAAFDFSAPTAVDDSRRASEPKILVDSADRIFITAPNGLLGPSRIWRSTDGGTSFAYVAPPNVVLGANPSVTIGGGDSDLVTDAQDNLYFIDLWLGDSSVAVSADHGASWKGQPLGTMPLQDRPWIAADPTQSGVVFSLTEQIPTGLWLSKSAGLLSGELYPLAVPEILNIQRGIVGADPPGTLVTNKKGDTYNVYEIFTGSGNGYGVGVSKLGAGGVLTDNSAIPPANGAGALGGFPVVAVDDAANDHLYVVWCDTAGPTGWEIRFASFDGTAWSSAATLGHGAFPWITAMSPGKVDVAWYGAELSSGYTGDPNRAPANTVWQVEFAQSLNALGSTPSFTLAQAVSNAPVKTGVVCTRGATCSGDRELADFLSIAHDSGGNAVISYTTVPSVGASLVRFVKQTTGATIK